MDAESTKHISPNLSEAGLPPDRICGSSQHQVAGEFSPANPSREILVAHGERTLEVHRSSIEKVIHLMREEPSAPLRSSTLAHTACMSRFHFLRVFRELTGTTPHDFLTGLRMEKAKRLLLESSLPVQKVCSGAGYASVGTFIRIFKERVGFTPKEFRVAAEAFSRLQVKDLVGVHLGSEKTENTFAITLQVSPAFAGFIFLGLFHLLTPCLAPISTSIVTQAEPFHICLPRPSCESFLLAMGFSNPLELRDYLVPVQSQALTGSTRVPAGFRHNGDGRPLALTLRKSSIFDPPTTICLPLLVFEKAAPGRDS
jgi:AraC-like DNA-binding protein